MTDQRQLIKRLLAAQATALQCRMAGIILNVTGLAAALEYAAGLPQPRQLTMAEAEAVWLDALQAQAEVSQ